MAIVCRFDTHRPGDPVRIGRLRTYYDRYVAVDIGEELAALTSLALGIRCRSGGLIREFRHDGDPRGRAVGFNHGPPQLDRPLPFHRPQLPLIAHDEAGGQRQVQLEDAIPLLERYPFTSQRKAIALVRAARMYAQAVWVADTNPELAWLSLVTACEIAATEQFGATDPTRPKRASHRAPRPTQRFLDFIEQHAPDPPACRPSIGLLEWSKMRTHCKLVYGWRSRALHDGVPFPLPMLEAPGAYGENATVSEIPLGLGATVGTSTWRQRDTTMLLHTFAYIARGCRIRWRRRTPMRR